MAKATRAAGLVVLGAAVVAASLSGQRLPQQVAAAGAAAGNAAPYDAVVTHLAGPTAGPGYAGSSLYVRR